MDASTLQDWAAAPPSPCAQGYTEDAQRLELWCRQGLVLLDAGAAVPALARRHTWRVASAQARADFIVVHGERVYHELTDGFRRMPRVDALLAAVPDLVPGLLPDAEQQAADLALELKDKYGFELSLGLVLAQWLAIPSVGRHLMASMRRPRPESAAALARFQAEDRLDLGLVVLHRHGCQAHVVLNNLDYLNAEDEVLVDAMEVAVDVVLLDPQVQVGVLRGGVMRHRKYLGRRVFCSGVNLTKLYRGQLPYLFYVERELGLVSKLWRGLWAGGDPLADAPDRGVEKPWIAAVEGHAIGGGCQLLLVCDHVIAETDAFVSIPARAEGFIPGLANLRLPQYMGRRLANRLIYRNARLVADSAEGRLLIDEVVVRGDMDAAIDRVADEMMAMGTHGIVSSRKAFRQAVEPIEQFRLYMATFCREQAQCMYGKEIVQNLEQFWLRRA
ncbi:MAG TPA: enoyl-CoA hydratase/isomerase family protein [Luteibacter sp.]|jgi:thioesterase DpgC|nr:enoyl-CoA hydratase/isomerase family protein [Luteibacter sp.]